MQKSSGFVGKDIQPEEEFSEVKLLHSSAEGYAQLYTVRRHGKLYVLKGLKPHYKDQPLYVQLLRKEYELGYYLDHPCICKVLGWEETTDNGPCIWMEYIDGETLSDFLIHHQMDHALTKKILGEICEALSYVHSKQIIHRDLKPENILITYIGQHVKLIDFGFSDSSDFEILKSPAGTLSYMAPEQKAGQSIDERVDIYAVGMVMKDLLQVLPNAKLKKVAERCTKQKPEERFTSAKELNLYIQSISEKRMPKWLIALLAIGVVAIIGIGSLLLSPDALKEDNATIQEADEVPAAIITEEELKGLP